MKKTITITLLLIATLATAQDRYTKGMQKGFELWIAGNNGEASNLFERIAMAEPDKWLPYYYVATVNTFAAFGQLDKEQHAQQLEKAQEAIDIAKAISPNNAEIMVIQAMIHTAWVVSDGAAYGMTLSPKVTALYAKAMLIDSENPRVVFSKTEWGMGSAKYFKQDLTPFCKEIERSLELFNNFKPESDLHPNWGKERAVEVAATCK